MLHSYCIVTIFHNVSAYVLWKVTIAVGGSRPPFIRLFLGPAHMSQHPKRNLDRFGHFCTAHGCAKHTQTTLHARSMAIDRMYSMCADYAAQIKLCCACCSHPADHRSFVRCCAERCKILWWICLLVCLSVCSHISETTQPNFLPNFYACCLCPWLCPRVTALRYVVYFRFCGWRRVFTQWALLHVVRIRKRREHNNQHYYTEPTRFCTTIKVSKYT